MPLTLEEANNIARTFVDGPASATRAGLIMLAPMIEGCSWQTEDIVKTTGLKRNQVEKVVCNLVRYGVWGTDVWDAEWPEMFVTGIDDMPDDKFQRLAISFVLDSMVGTGELRRTKGEDGQFLYQKSA